ncbi:MAG: uracil-DNA glycosylase family protein [Acidimicrobiales bacterium]
MDDTTAAIYERRARWWTAHRRPSRRRAARAFAGRLAERQPAGSVVADLGSGPGWYASDLPAPVVAVDVARAMLELTGENAPSALRVQADLEHLPFRRDGLGGAWAANSYVHLARTALPLALADLHRSVVVGGLVHLRLLAGDYEGHQLPGDDLPGRFFASWRPDRVADVLAGAGFDLVDLHAEPAAHGDRLVVEAVRVRSLPDYVGPGMRVLVVGLNPSLYAADAGVGFARPGNRLWPALAAAGLATRDRDPTHTLTVHRVGMTDLVKRATTSARALTTDEYRAGFERVERLAGWLRPAAVCFLGVTGWREAVDPRSTLGWQSRLVGGRPAYMMPNPSGANAHARLEDLVAHLRAAAAGPGLAQS